MVRLEAHYKDSVVPALIERFGYSSVMQVPRIEKITLNMGLGEALTDKNVLDAGANDLAVISGQKPIVTKARKSERLPRLSGKDLSRSEWSGNGPVTCAQPNPHWPPPAEAKG
jgi:ribosomal protein L5